MEDLKKLFLEHRQNLFSLRELMLEERGALIKEDGVSLSEIVERKSAIAENLQRLEEIRHSQYGEVNLANLEDEETDALVGELRHLGQEIADEQETNLLLIEQSIAYSNMLMRTVQDMVKKTGTYDKNGKMDGNSVQAGLNKSV